MYSVLNTQNINVKNLPLNSNLINFSILKQYASPINFRSFSIKYVVEGMEKYTVNGHPFHVQQCQYILANAYCEGKVEVDSKKTVTGICIDVAPSVISAAVASYVDAGSTEPDPGLDRFLNTPDFLENTYSASETNLGRTLDYLGRILQRDPYAERDFDDDFYFSLAESIVADHAQVLKQLDTMQALKNTTRKELYRKLHRARLFMDEHFAMPINVAGVAREATLSEYHFYRLFKTVYGTTPNRYLVSKRLEKAQALLKKGYGPVAFIAVQVGFPDVYSFSKSFKKHFGINPSQVFK